jgi:hypothetical protein
LYARTIINSVICRGAATEFGNPFGNPFGNQPDGVEETAANSEIAELGTKRRNLGRFVNVSTS